LLSRGQLAQTKSIKEIQMKKDKKQTPHSDDMAKNPNGRKEQLERAQRILDHPENEFLTTDQGVPVADNHNQLRAGTRGPSLTEDFIFREKMTHFDHERIPERVVHARGSAAHGTFQVYESMAEYTKAKFLQDPAVKTPVFVRFSTVVGFRGSSDTVRDVRGFATKFYTEEGNFDLVGNNMPVFFIQDAMKFPDLVHSIKPQPHNEMPQASAAHDNFWDFISLMPESMHMIMWVLSDRALPRSYAMMEGFGVHTFRFVNEAGTSRFVKFHWKPMLGVHSLVWDETQKLAGKDPDFNRRDLWERIEMGDFVEFELGVQIVEEADAGKFDFDLLDATKIIPEELVPVRRIGRMTLDRNPDNFFTETEQVAFHPGHLVPGIDFSNDPLLQGRLFSYLDTQLNRFNGTNFAEIPINQAHCPVFNNNQDGFMRHTGFQRRVNYEPNSLNQGHPRQATMQEHGFVSYPEATEGHKVRERSESFGDHFTQATLFWNSLSEVEKTHLVEAIHFELGKVEHKHIRQRMIQLFANVDRSLAERAAQGIGVTSISDDLGYLAESPAPKPNDRRGAAQPGISAALSMENPDNPKTARTRKVAILVADGFDHEAVMRVKSALKEAGVTAKIISKNGGMVTAANGEEVEVDKTFVTTASVLFDALFLPGGRQSIETLKTQGHAVHWINETFKHCKPIAGVGEGVDLLQASGMAGVQLAEAGTREQVVTDKGIVTSRRSSSDGSSDLDAIAEQFIQAIAQHRHWSREEKDRVPA
jgi:catalase